MMHGLDYKAALQRNLSTAQNEAPVPPAPKNSPESSNGQVSQNFPQKLLSKSENVYSKKAINAQPLKSNLLEQKREYAHASSSTQHTENQLSPEKMQRINEWFEGIQRATKKR